MNGLADSLAAVNASLNGLSAVLIALGFIAVRRQQRRLHGRLMLAAVTVSALFLIGYLTRVYLSGTHRYPGSGGWRTVYFVLLSSHMLLAAVTPFLVIRTVYLALRQRLAEHRRLVRYTLPIWMYVSVTGVLVYLMLYHPPG